MNLHLALATLPLVSLYTRWCSLAKRTPGSLTSWDGCMWAAFTDPHSGDLASADLVSQALHRHADRFPQQVSITAELAVRADQLQAAGDPRGEWLAIWLMPSSEYRDRAVIDSTPALAQHVERLIAEHERRARRTKTIPKAGPWSIEPNSTLVLRIDGGPDQVVTFRAGDFADTQRAIPLEIVSCINEQLVGGYAVPVDETVEIESLEYSGRVEIIGGSAASSLGVWRLFDPTLFNVDYSALESRIVAMHGRAYGRSAHVAALGERLHTGRLHGNSFNMLVLDDVAHRVPSSRGTPSPYIDIRSPSVHDEVAVKPVDEAALARMREAFAAFATRRVPVSAEVLQAIATEDPT